MNHILLFSLLLISSCLSQSSPNTWVERTMDYQITRLQRNLPIDQTSWIGSHNSFSYIRTDYNGTTSRPASELLSQTHPLLEQILLGARMFELGMHLVDEFDTPEMVCNGNQYFYDTCYDSGSSQVSTFCSAFLKIIDYGELNTGCFSFYDRTLLQTLDEINSVLTYPSLFMMVKLNANYDTGSPEGIAFTNLLNSYLVNIITPAKIYSPADLLLDGGVYPSMLTLNNRGKRVLFHGFDSTTGLYNTSLVHQDFSPPASPVSSFDADNCDGLVAIPDNTPWVRFFEDTTTIASYFDASDLLGKFDETSLLQVIGCGFSPFIDDIDEHKNVWASHIWQINEPSHDILNPPTEYCVIQNRISGRWISTSCQINKPFCCRQGNTWAFSTNSLNGDQWSSVACPPGYTFSAPITRQDQLDLATFQNAQRASCWIPAPPINVVPDYIPPPENTDTEGTAQEIISSEEDGVAFNASNGNLLRWCDIDLSQFFPNSSNSSGSGSGTQNSSGIQDICDWNGYVSNVVDNSMGFIIFSAIVLGFSVIFWVLLCIFLCKRCCSDDDEDDKGAIVFILYGIPAVLALIGLIMIVVGSSNVSAAFNTAEDDLLTIFGRIEAIRDDGINQREDLERYFDPDFVNETLSTVSEGVAQIDEVLTQAGETKDTVDYYRSLGTLIFGIIPIVFVILGFIFYRVMGSTCLVCADLVVEDVLVVIIAVIMIVHFSIGVVQNDICNELTREDGVLVLLKEQARLAFDGLTLLITDAIPEITKEGCAVLTDICNLPGQECGLSGQCTRQDVENALNNISIYDEADNEDKSLEECSQTCTDQDLQDLASEAYTATTTMLNFLDLIDLIDRLLNDIVSGDTIDNFSEHFCIYMGNALTLMYIGCGTFIVALITSIILLLFFQGC